MTATTTVREAINDLVEFMNEASVKFTKERFPNLAPGLFQVEGGRKYIKISQSNGQTSVHCFVDAQTGDVYKPAGWKAPALNGARFNILDPASLAELKERFDVFGSYLYKKW